LLRVDLSGPDNFELSSLVKLEPKPVLFAFESF
jgi:hypothetical protein